MKKKLPIIVAFILTIVAAVLYGNTSKVNRIYDNNINTIAYADLGTLSDGEVVSQAFVCKADVVDGFKIKAGVAGNLSDTNVHVEVYDVNSNVLLCSIDEPGTVFKPRKLHYFHTDRLTGMKGKQLLLTLREEGSQPGNGVLFYYTPTATADSNIVVGEKTIDGLLPMATVTEKFDVETFLIFLFSVWFIWGFMWALYKLFSK